ncbi:LCP family protein [Luteococcus sp.]|uniref:LCP family protein n=1 Tax=Luteococcus sp. TaxID=1969402 RepID=UPI003735D86A
MTHEVDDRLVHPARPRHRGRRILLALLVLGLVLALGGVGLYRHLNQNLETVELPTDIQGSQVALPGLPKGVAQNIVVIGTDSRQNPNDCKLGGSCGDAKIDGDTNADVIMLVHISADHDSMSVMSIPRDTTVDLPACEGNGHKREAGRDRINGTLNYGIDCTLRTIHDMTGLPIHHFAMIDFSGVVSLSDAVGGVDVCVNADVYDTYSHLKLAQGDHTLEGVAALQFVRSRHGFGDGSDLGRTVAQHLYLSALQRKLESAGTLLNPQKVYRLADAATKALTVDSGLDSVGHLAQVVTTVGRVPSSSTAFLTLPTAPNPNNPNTVVPAEKAKSIFAKLRADQPLVDPSPSPSASASDASEPASSAPQASASSQAATPSTSASPSADPEDQASQAQEGKVKVSSESTGCAAVSTQKTVEINGVPMTPTEAFHNSPKIPVSAP